MIQLPLCGRVAENTPRNGRFWTLDGRRRLQLDAASSLDANPDWDLSDLVTRQDLTAGVEKIGWWLLDSG
jgi:hypothetical protein